MSGGPTLIARGSFKNSCNSMCLMHLQELGTWHTFVQNEFLCRWRLNSFFPAVTFAVNEDNCANEQNVIHCSDLAIFCGVHGPSTARGPTFGWNHERCITVAGTSREQDMLLIEEWITPLAVLLHYHMSHSP
jgi:hypothetical protein